MAEITQGRIFRLVLPHLPPSNLNPNQLRRICWQARSVEMKAALGEAYCEAVSQWQGQPVMKRAAVSYEFHVKTWRRRDTDNLRSACKPYIDGLVQAGILIDDDCWTLESGIARVFYTGEESTIIEIKEILEE